jgi:anaerobic magnesium-protoporphyrin IX monomethyl ester cyclase
VQFSRCPHLCNYCGQRGFGLNGGIATQSNLQRTSTLIREFGVELINFADELPLPHVKRGKPF